jgi:hypothetical protein
MAAADRPFGMAVGAGVAAKIMAVFFYSLAGVNNAETGVAGAFHLGNGGHGKFPLRLSELN